MKLPNAYLALLAPKVQEFIHCCKEDLSRLAFKGSPFDGVDLRLLLQQIEGKRRIRSKLPLWEKTKEIIYPPRINLEQCSSEATARYKAGLLKAARVADITGGFGVDSYYFSLYAEEVTYFDTDPVLAAIAAHNVKQLKAENITVNCGDGLIGLKRQAVDLVYVDPSRRSDSKGKVFFLEDCLPNVAQELDSLLKASSRLLVKTSPMLDLSIGIKTLKYVRTVHVIAVDNEVKELLFAVDRDHGGDIQIVAANLVAGRTDRLQFAYGHKPEVTFSAPKTYLYEPNAAIMKSGGFAHITNRFEVFKLQQSTHLYTSDALMKFPGRRFLIDRVFKYNKASIKEIRQLSSAHISTRNFPYSAKELRKNLKIKDGGDTYLFFATGPENNKLVLLCSKV